MSKADKWFIIISTLFAIFMAIILIWFYNKADNDSSSILEEGLQKQTPDSIYNEHEDVLGLKIKNEITIETDINKALKDVTPEVAIVLDNISQFYNASDFESLYNLINHEYLETKNVTLSYPMFKAEQEKLLDTGYVTNKIRFDRVTRISSYYYCDISIIEDNGSDQENGSSTVNATFTIFFHKEGTYSYLPFNIDDLFIKSDYGVSRVSDIPAAIDDN